MNFRKALLFVLFAILAVVLALALLIVVVLRLFIWIIAMPRKMGKWLQRDLMEFRDTAVLWKVLSLTVGYPKVRARVV